MSEGTRFGNGGWMRRTVLEWPPLARCKAGKGRQSNLTTFPYKYDPRPKCWITRSQGHEYPMRAGVLETRAVTWGQQALPRSIWNSEYTIRPVNAASAQWTGWRTFATPFLMCICRVSDSCCVKLMLFKSGEILPGYKHYDAARWQTSTMYIQVVG